tara:strand:- start:1918 stop:2340 length:423 start_codon:yes stop_codon:yes gene_type:complete
LSPSKSKVIVDITAKSLNIDQNLVKDLTSFYWSKIRKSLTGLEFPAITLHGLGEMTIRPVKLKEFTEDFTNLKKYVNPKKFGGYQRMKIIDNKLERLVNMQLMLDIQEMKRDQSKIKKNEYQKNLEKQSSNSGGDPEQPL